MHLKNLKILAKSQTISLKTHQIGVIQVVSSLLFLPCFWGGLDLLDAAYLSSPVL